MLFMELFCILTLAVVVWFYTVDELYRTKCKQTYKHWSAIKTSEVPARLIDCIVKNIHLYVLVKIWYIYLKSRYGGRNTWESRNFLPPRSFPPVPTLQQSGRFTGAMMKSEGRNSIWVQETNYLHHHLLLTMVNVSKKLALGLEPRHPSGILNTAKHLPKGCFCICILCYNCIQI